MRNRGGRLGLLYVRMDRKGRTSLTYDDDGPIKYRAGTKLTKTMIVTIVKYEVNDDSYTVVDSDGDAFEVSSDALHDGSWDVFPDA